MELMLVRRPSPAWLERLLSTTFFTVCKAHMKAPRNQCNMYCLDCSSSSSREEEEEEDHAFCFYCRQSWHNNHQVIQIRRFSYHDVVKVAEIQKALEISGENHLTFMSH